MDISHFVNITSRAWTIPILSSLHEGVAGRQAPLLTATGASRSAFAHSIDHLIKMGLLERNPGHGHPLRPEFRLTKAGHTAALLANRIHIASKNEDQNLLRRSWTIPILTSLQRPRYFNEIKRDLTTITDRALSQSLKAMETRHWVRRSVNDAARPPRSMYETINFGIKISQITGAEINTLVE
ncbi:winged helix-turn-helix transcriptional regulator [Labrenzia sp. DG1229]|uniref:winged helix-turn-helix transcriptional regulator n=1 Tax=Labrenzia sp. DG1229 TaxID=681847 RepID=UPI00048EBCC5|nr:winged helix-turn-helix transcriptional regulator [Labrenzia sp. DG1229]